MKNTAQNFLAETVTVNRLDTGFLYDYMIAVGYENVPPLSF